MAPPLPPKKKTAAALQRSQPAELLSIEPLRARSSQPLASQIDQRDRDRPIDRLVSRGREKVCVCVCWRSWKRNRRTPIVSASYRGGGGSSPSGKKKSDGPSDDGDDGDGRDPSLAPPPPPSVLPSASPRPEVYACATRPRSEPREALPSLLLSSLSSEINLNSFVPWGSTEE